jgi:hypothetical protein
MSTKGFLIDGVFDLYKQFYKLSQKLVYFFVSCLLWFVHDLKSLLTHVLRSFLFHFHLCQFFFHLLGITFLFTKPPYAKKPDIR